MLDIKIVHANWMRAPHHKILYASITSQTIELINLKCDVRGRIRRAAGVAHCVRIHCYVVIPGPNASPTASSAGGSPAVRGHHQETEQACSRDALSQSAHGFRWNQNQSKNDKTRQHET